MSGRDTDPIFGRRSSEEELDGESFVMRQQNREDRRSSEEELDGESLVMWQQNREDRRLEREERREAKKRRAAKDEVRRLKRNEEAKEARRRRENAFADPSSHATRLKRRREQLFDRRGMPKREVSVELPEEMWRIIFAFRASRVNVLDRSGETIWFPAMKSTDNKKLAEGKKLAGAAMRRSIARAIDDLVHLRAVNKSFLGYINDLITTDYDWYTRKGCFNKLSIVWTRETP
jgi:hypothetical protein